jgi:hypothetical protein
VLLGAALVWAWLAIGLRLLSAGGAWQLGWIGSLVTATVLWPAFAIGYVSLQRIVFGGRWESVDAAEDLARSAPGVPVLVVGFAWAVLVLGLLRFLSAFDAPARGGVTNFLMSVLMLNVLCWGAAGATHWAVTAWNNRE